MPILNPRCFGPKGQKSEPRSLSEDNSHHGGAWKILSRTNKWKTETISLGPLVSIWSAFTRSLLPVAMTEKWDSPVESFPRFEVILQRCDVTVTCNVFQDQVTLSHSIHAALIMLLVIKSQKTHCWLQVSLVSFREGPVIAGLVGRGSAPVPHCKPTCFLPLSALRWNIWFSCVRLKELFCKLLFDWMSNTVWARCGYRWPFFPSFHKLLAALQRRIKHDNWSSHLLFSNSRLNWRPDILASSINSSSKFMLLIQQICNFSHIFQSRSSPATGLACVLPHHALCPHLLSTSHSTFSISNWLQPPPTLPHSWLIPAPAASARPSPSSVGLSSSRGGCSLAVMTWETIMAAIM